MPPEPPAQPGEGTTPMRSDYAPPPDFHAGQALEAATAMARATTALGQLAAASSGFGGMLPTVRGTEGAPGPAGASRRIQPVIQSIMTHRGLSLRLANALPDASEGAKQEGSDYPRDNKLSKHP